MKYRIFKENKLVIASHNQGKIREIRELLQPLNIEILSAYDLKIEEPEENFEDKEMKVKLSPPIMYEYEKANIISKRKTQLDNNKPSTMEEYILKHKITSSFEIANIEFDNGKLPNFYIMRKFDKGYYEKWRFNDFVYLPK